MMSLAMRMRAKAMAINRYKVVQTMGKTIDGGVIFGLMHSYHGDFTERFVKYCPPNEVAITEVMAIRIARAACICVGMMTLINHRRIISYYTLCNANIATLHNAKLYYVIQVEVIMKYAKELHQIMQRLPASLQEASLSYKMWKKRCHNIALQEAIVLLKVECEKVDSLFTTSYAEWSEPPSKLCSIACFKYGKVVPIDPNMLLLYAQINAKTMYKICKRLGKIKHDPTPMNWFTSIRASHTFEFLGGHHTTHLQLRQHNPKLSIECPLCTEEVAPNYMLIYACGHHACVHCTLQYAKAPTHGLWYHVLAYAQRWDCPYCRYNKALFEVTTAMPM